MSKLLTAQYTPLQQDFTLVLRLFIWQRTSTKISLVSFAILYEGTTIDIV